LDRWQKPNRWLLKLIMFLVSHSLEVRANEIRQWLRNQPSVSLLVAAVYFEWTVSRVVLALSLRPNLDVRQDLVRVYGLEKYRALWRAELQHLNGAQRLTEVVTDWQAVTEAFDARNRLIHGRDRYTRKMATPHVEALLTAVSEINEYCLSHGANINRRMPVRRRRNKAT
jgi:hypothetical protein